MPKKACCCNTTTQPNGPCVQLTPECVGQKYRFTADFLLKYLCVPDGQPSYDVLPTFTACNGQVFVLKQNLEHWRLTWEHTITSNDYVYGFFRLFANSSEYTLQKISPGPSYLTIEIVKHLQTGEDLLSYGCDDYAQGCRGYNVAVTLGIGYKEVLPCGVVWEMPYVQDTIFGFAPCGNEVYFVWARGMETTNQTCIITSKSSGQQISSGPCAGRYWGEYLIKCGHECNPAATETQDGYVKANSYLSGGNIFCSNGCKELDSSTSLIQTHFYGYRSLLVEKI